MNVLFLFILPILIAVNKGHCSKLSDAENLENLKSCGKRTFKPSPFKIYRKGATTLAKFGQFPWAAQLLHSDNRNPSLASMDMTQYLHQILKISVCGAVLISKRHLLTAAHCVVKNCHAEKGPINLSLKDKETFQAVIGVTDLTRAKSKNFFKISSIKVLDQFTKGASCFDSGDIAILELDRNVPVDRKNFNPICCSRPMDPIVKKLEIAGWGFDPKHLTPNEISELAYAEVLRKPIEECVEIYKLHKWDHLIQRMDKSCATETEGNACAGDSGGPLMYRGAGGKMFLSGIVAFGTDCSTLHNYEIMNQKINMALGGMYTDIRIHTPWVCELSGVCPDGF